jgi:alkanesulfonate monooxygenase SsuD/methylene tetrahydromethanopterin reductase-like flavin-dependent oxidoreductase (luciferase family)
MTTPIAATPPANELDFGIVTGQHWRSWEMLLEQWRWTEATGWDSAWTFDHFYSLRPSDDGECLEGWTLLAALAMVTERVRLGTLVTGVTHRHPAVLLKQAVTVDHISGGRLILGIGAAWTEGEHRAYGIPFPAPRERVDLFGETMEVLRRFETQERTTFHGAHMHIEDAPFVPKPLHGHMPVMIGTSGKRMLRHVGRYADYWDSGTSPELIPALHQQVREHAQAAGRDPETIRLAVSAYFGPASNPNAPVVIWENSQDEVETRFREHVQRYARVGVQTFLFNMPYEGANANMNHVAQNVIPELRETFRRNGQL